MKFGYRWIVGDGAKFRFWEDTSFGTAPLVVQFWGLFSICNQIGAPLSEVWVNGEVRLSFRRTFSDQMFSRWLELVEIVSSIEYNDGGDSLVWEYDSKRVYTSKSLYAIINFRGIVPMYIPAVWKIKVPPRIQVFLWLLSHNKLMTVDNLLERRI